MSDCDTEVVGVAQVIADRFPHCHWRPEHTIAAADLLAEVVRYLNHASLPCNVADALRYPSQMYQVIAHIETAAHRLTQLIAQLAERQSDMERTLDLEIDGLGGNHDVRQVCEQIERSLHQASATAAASALQLSSAANLAARLKIR